MRENNRILIFPFLKYLPKIEISKYLKILQEQLEPYTTTIHIYNSLFFLFKKKILKVHLQINRIYK